MIKIRPSTPSQAEIESLARLFNKVFLEPASQDDNSQAVMPLFADVVDRTSLNVRLQFKLGIINEDLYREIEEILHGYLDFLKRDHTGCVQEFEATRDDYQNTLNSVGPMSENPQFHESLTALERELWMQTVVTLKSESERWEGQILQLNQQWDVAYRDAADSLQAADWDLALIRLVQLAQLSQDYYGATVNLSGVMDDADRRIENFAARYRAYDKGGKMTNAFLWWFLDYMNRNASEPNSLFWNLDKNDRDEIRQLGSAIFDGATPCWPLVTQAKKWLRALYAALAPTFADERHHLEHVYRHGFPYDRNLEEQIDRISVDGPFLKTLNHEKRKLAEHTLPDLAKNILKRLGDAYYLIALSSTEKCFYGAEFVDDEGYLNITNSLIAHECIESATTDLTKTKIFYEQLLNKTVDTVRDIRQADEDCKFFNEQAADIISLFDAFDAQQAKAGLSRQVDPETKAVRYVDDSSRRRHNDHYDNYQPTHIINTNGTPMVPGTGMDLNGNPFGSDW